MTISIIAEDYVDFKNKKYKDYIYSDLQELEVKNNWSENLILAQYDLYKKTLEELKTFIDPYVEIIKYVKEKKTLCGININIDTLSPFEWFAIFSCFSSEEIGEWCQKDAFSLQQLRKTKIPTVAHLLQEVLSLKKDYHTIDFSLIYDFFNYLAKNYLPELTVTFDYSDAYAECSKNLNSIIHNPLKKYSKFKPLWKSFNKFENQIIKEKITDQARADRIKERKKEEDRQIITMLVDYLDIPGYIYTKDHEKILKLCGPVERWSCLLFDQIGCYPVLSYLFTGKIKQIITILNKIKENKESNHYLYKLLTYKPPNHNLLKQSEFTDQTFLGTIEKLHAVASDYSNFNNETYKNYLYNDLFKLKNNWSENLVTPQYDLYQKTVEELKTFIDPYAEIIKYVKQDLVINMKKKPIQSI